MPEAQILVVEDEFIVAKDIQNTLTNLGYAVPAIASSGNEAIKKAGEFQPDLVLMDIVLKGPMDGVKTADEIRNRFNIPVIYLTAYADENTLHRAKITEPYGYIIKPFEEKELHTAIEMALYKKKMEKRLKESEKKYRMVFENLNVGIYRVTPGKDGEFIDINPALVNILGYRNKEEILDLKVSDIYFNPENRKEFNKKITKAGFVRNEELHVKKRDGTPIIVSDTGIAVYNDHGEITHFEGILEDITERIRMEEALRDSEERYRRLVEYFPVPMLVHNEGLIVYVNPETVKFFGATSTVEIIGRSIIDFIHPDQQKNVNIRLREMEDSDKPLEPITLKLIRLDGQMKSVEMLAMPIIYHYKHAGQVVLRDITQPKEMENALRENEEKYRNLVERANDGIAIIQDGVLKYINPRAEEMTGFRLNEVFDTPFTDYIHPSEVSRLVKLNKKIMSGKVTPQMIESAIMDKDGRRIDVEISGGLVTYQQQPANQVFIREITERKRIEEALRESEEKYRRLFEESIDTIFITTRDGNCIDFNHSMIELFGYSKEELTGINVRHLYHDPKERIKFQKEIELRGSVRNYELKLRKKDGAILDCLINATVRMDIDGNILGYQGIIRDITERKRTEEKYYDLVEHSLQGLLIFQDNRIVFANKTITQITGFTQKELYSLTGSALQEIVHPDDRERVWTLIRERLTEKEMPPRNEFRFIRKDGSPAWIETLASFIEYKGKPAVQAAVVDITERKKAEEQILVANERLQYLLSSSSAVIYAAKTSEDYGATFISDNVFQMVGYKPKEFLKRSNFWLDHVHPDDQHRVSNEAQKVFDKEFHDYEYRFKCKNGKYIWVNDSMRLVRDKDGNPIEIIGYWIDITERKRTEEALRESEEKFRLISEQSILGIVIIQDNVIKYCNHAVIELLGYSMEEIMKWKPGEFGKVIHPDDRDFVMEQARKKQAGDKDVITQYEYHVITKDKKIKWITQYSKTIPYKGKTADLVTFIDITDKKQ